MKTRSEQFDEVIKGHLDPISDGVTGENTPEFIIPVLKYAIERMEDISWDTEQFKDATPDMNGRLLGIKMVAEGTKNSLENLIKVIGLQRPETQKEHGKESGDQDTVYLAGEIEIIKKMRKGVQAIREMKEVRNFPGNDNPHADYDNGIEDAVREMESMLAVIHIKSIFQRN
jgi:hypothetical protein